MPGNLDRKFREAVSHFQARELEGSERLCDEVLRKSPRHAGALHLLGLVRLAGGRAREAVGLISRAAERDPGNPVVLENLGVALLAAGDGAAAEPALRRALGLGAAHATLHMRLGLALLSQRRLPEAVAALRVAAEKAPQDPDVVLNLGHTLAQAGKPEEALACYQKVLALYPGHANASFNVAAQLQRMGRDSDAIAAYQALLAHAPGDADAHHNLGTVYQQQGRLDEAAASFRKVLALNGNYVASLNTLGNVLRKQGRLDDAVELYEKALAVDPGHIDAYVNLGNARAEQRRFEEAQALFERALGLDSGSYEAHENLGFALSAQQLWREAIPAYEHALALNPASSKAQFSLGVARLFLHEFEQAWPLYERRLEGGTTSREDPASVALYESLPRWRGPADASVQEVAIWSEQGIGDQVLFSTLIPELDATGVAYIYEVDKRLLGAYERSFPAARFVAYSEPPDPALQRAQRVLFAGSLPGFFRASKADFMRQPARLLSALPERVEHFRSRLDALGTGPKVALSWRSARKDFMGPKKSVALIQLVPLLRVPGARFVDVQYGDTAAERREVEEATAVRLTRFDDVDYFNDLEDLLAILEACDLLITTSNATAHFAGALGKRTWLVFPGDRPALHYWAHGGAYRSLWYPSVEIVTGRHLADWPALVQHTADRLGATIGEHRPLA